VDLRHDIILVQIAKMLQNLANKPSYAKELYMITLNPFVENNKARINQFLNNLCEIGDFFETLEARFLLFIDRVFTDIHYADGSIYGSLEEGLADKYHIKRAIQYSFPTFATHRGASTYISTTVFLSSHIISPRSRLTISTTSVS
jgi:hypothetical protein